jgi:small neutral amino acid transporter SnatA (MarC family)
MFIMAISLSLAEKLNRLISEEAGREGTKRNTKTRKAKQEVAGVPLAYPAFLGPLGPEPTSPVCRAQRPQFPHPYMLERVALKSIVALVDARKRKK